MLFCGHHRSFCDARSVTNGCSLADLRGATMPNGRSGGFIIEKADLNRLVKNLPDAQYVCKIVKKSPRLQPADALEIARLVDECPKDRIAVEEQDDKFYVIHLSNEPELLWLMVGSESPIYPELRRRHAWWVTERRAHYDLTHMKAPALRGLTLRLMTALLERRAFAALLAPLLARGLGIKEFREARIADSPTFQPLHSSGTKSCAKDQTPNDVPRLVHRKGGFHFRTIRDFQSAYQNGIVTPEQVAGRVVAAIEESDRLTPPVRAFIACNPDDVRRQARESELRYKEGRTYGPLDGVPIAIKDEVDMVPYPTTAGTSFLGNSPAEIDSTVVDRLRKAGAMLIGKTNMHEIGLLPDSVNPHHGTVRNPYNLLHEAGGSSSGSAAAVAAGLCPAAIGADGGGSIRIPAAFCGVVGLKPNECPYWWRQPITFFDSGHSALLLGRDRSVLIAALKIANGKEAKTSF